jgi:hypothetical protein
MLMDGKTRINRINLVSPWMNFHKVRINYLSPWINWLHLLSLASLLPFKRDSMGTTMGTRLKSVQKPELEEGERALRHLLHSSQPLHYHCTSTTHPPHVVRFDPCWLYLCSL